MDEFDRLRIAHKKLVRAEAKYYRAIPAHNEARMRRSRAGHYDGNWRWVDGPETPEYREAHDRMLAAGRAWDKARGECEAILRELGLYYGED